MAKQIETYIKLQVPAGAASPSPPVGPALGQHGLPLMDFCNAFNARTKDVEPGMPCPVVITVYEDKSFEFIIKTTPASVLIKKAAGNAQPHLNAKFGSKLFSQIINFFLYFNGIWVN